MKTATTLEEVQSATGKWIGTIRSITAYIFIFLFLYTASSKLMDFDTFHEVLSKSELIGHIAEFLAWGIPIAEIFVSGLLIAPGTRRKGLFLSLLLMLLFTGYLLYMTLFTSNRTCHCGGVISSLSWEQHIWFNLAFIVLATLAIWKRNR